MNIVEASYRVGLDLKRSKEGEELLSLYKEAQESVPLQTWRDFEKVGRKKWGEHYFRYPYSLAIFEANLEKENLPLPLKVSVEKVLNSNKIKIFCKKCEKMGIALEELAKNIFLFNLPRNFSGINTPPKLVRSLQDLSISCQRTGLLKIILQNYKPKEFLEKMNEFDIKKKNLKSTTPFSHEIRKLAYNISNEKMPLESIYTMEAFTVVLNSLKQVIFESHLDLIIKLNIEDMMNLKKREKNKLTLYSMKLNENMLNIMNWNGSIINFDQDNKTHFALVKTRRLSWLSRDSPSTIGIWGIIYPHDDSIS